MKVVSILTERVSHSDEPSKAFWSQAIDMANSGTPVVFTLTRGQIKLDRETLQEQAQPDGTVAFVVSPQTLHIVKLAFDIELPDIVAPDVKAPDVEVSYVGYERGATPRPDVVAPDVKSPDVEVSYVE